MGLGLGFGFGLGLEFGLGSSIYADTLGASSACAASAVASRFFLAATIRRVRSLKASTPAPCSAAMRSLDASARAWVRVRVKVRDRLRLRLSVRVKEG